MKVKKNSDCAVHDRGLQIQLKKELVQQRRTLWANSLRKVVTRADAIDEFDGSLNQNFFRPTKIRFESSGKKWGSEQREKLLEGLEKLGVGEWAKMKEMFERELGEWSTLDLRGSFLSPCRARVFPRVAPVFHVFEI